MTAIPEDLDYLATRVHGRRSQLAEGERLEALCGLRSLEALGRAVFPGSQAPSAVGFQRRVAAGWLREMEELAGGLGWRRARMMEAIAHRLAIEDQKVEARGLAAGVPPEALQRQLVRPLAVPGPTPSAGAEGAAIPPPGRDVAGRRQARAALPAQPAGALARETALDRRSLEGLVAAMEGLDRADRSGIGALVGHEVDHFHLMLVARGRFLRGLAPADLLPWQVEGAGITREILSGMLSAPDLARAAAMAVGAALDRPPPEPVEATSLDRLAWQRFLRLARRTFREGATGLAVLVGYAALRRVEVRNLTTLSEGIRLGLPTETIRAHLVPPGRREVARA